MLTYLLMLAFQILILVLIAYGFHWLFRRRPAIQHFVWLTTIFSIGLAIPLQSQIPSLEWRVPVAMEATERVPGSGARTVSDSRKRSALKGSFADAAAEFIAEPTAATSGHLADVTDIKATGSKPLEHKSESANFTVWHWVVAAYVAIVLALLLRLMFGIRQLQQLAKAACATSVSTAMVDATIQKIGLRRKVRVLLSDRIDVPMAFGIWRPVVLLPNSFEAWSKESQQAVLLHELTHIQRFDAFWDLMSRLVAIAYWFHPAVHFSTSRLRQTRERATDRLVLGYGVSPTEYAKQLLDLAAGPTRLRQPAIHMSCDGDIKNRIDSILNCVSGPPRQSWAMKSVLVTAFVALASVSVSVSYATVEQQDDGSATIATPELPSKKKRRTTRADVTGRTFYERVQQVTPREYKSNQTVSISGKVTDEEGKPVADAIVVLRDASMSRAMGSGAINDVLAKTTTRSDGTYSFDQLGLQVNEWGFTSAQLFCVSANKIGFKYLSAVRDYSSLAQNTDIELVDTADVTGRVVDADGKPVAGTLVRMGYLSKHVGGIQKQIPFNDRLINPESMTDDDGRFELPGLPSGFAVRLNLQHSDFATKLRLVRTTKDHPEFVVYPGGSKADVAENGATIELKKGAEFSGIVTDENSNPIEGIVVATDWRNCVTDSEGRFELRMIERAADSTVDLFVFIKHGFSRISKVEQSKLKDGTANLQFLPPATIKAKVVSAHSGQPIEGFRVRFDAEGSNNMVRGGVSDVDGNLEALIESGKIQMTLQSRDSRLYAEKATGEGWKPLAKESPIGGAMIGEFEIKTGETKEITIRVPVRDATRARVLDANGDPVEGALVGYQSMGGGTYGFATTDADGMAGVDPPDLLFKTRLLIAKYEQDGKVFFAEKNTTENVELATVDLKLRPSITVTGKVSVEDQPLADATIFVRRPNGVHPAYVVADGMTNERGEYSIQAPRGAAKGQLPSYRIEVGSPQIPNDKISIAPNKVKLVDGMLRGDVNLIRGTGEIAGVVVNSVGDPVVNSLVEVQHLMMRRPERKELHPSQLVESMSRYTDSDGRFKFIGLPEGYEAIVVAGVGNATRGASVISVGNRASKVLVTNGEESKLNTSFR